MVFRYPKAVMTAFLIFALLGSYLAATRLRFSFDLEQFFPSEDPDLAFFMEFKARFEPDDNFLLLALYREQGIFEQGFLQKANQLSEDLRNLELPLKRLAETDSLDGEQFYKRNDSLFVKPIQRLQSILDAQYPIKTPFGLTSLAAIHIEDPERYEDDKTRLLEDPRFAGSLLAKDGKSLVLAMKTVDNIQQEPAEKLIAAVHERLKHYGFQDYHILGRANFQTEMVALQIKEFILSCVVSFLLVLGVMFLIFRKFWGVVIASTSIMMGLGVFVGMLGLLGATLDTMALLYPIVMIIVATSDVVHVMTKYTDELYKGKTRKEAMNLTLREIGLAVLLTSVTTAIGFGSLLSSKVEPIKYFGIYAAMGVLLAYATVILFTTSFLSLFERKDIILDRDTSQVNGWWTKTFDQVYQFSKNYPKSIALGTSLFLLLCFWGISKVHTNTQIANILPKNNKLTEDFVFFEQTLGGFRPFEVAVSLKAQAQVDDYAVVKALADLETEMAKYPALQSPASISILYKSLHRAFNGDQAEFYTMPDEEDFERYNKFVSKFKKTGELGMLISQDERHLRLSSRVLDVGADEISRIQAGLDAWIAANVPKDLMEIKQTGTGIIVDKNSEYVRDSLLWGLGFSVLVIGIFMVFLYRSIKMLFIFLLANLIPLLFAAALLGFMDVPLEAGVAIVFGIVFGIAVDDTIHLLGRYRLLRNQGLDLEERIRVMLQETGKAISLTSIILFFGFLILLFSSNPPAVIVGSLISATLVSALVIDVLILPPLLRWLDKA